MSTGSAHLTAPADVWGHPVEVWTPSLDRQALEHVLEKVRAWQPFDGGALLDDVAEVLDDTLPSGEDVEVLDQRLRGHLTRLVDIAVAAEAEQRDQPVAQLLEHASAMRVQDMPVDHRQAVGHLRRMGWAVNELLERLVETGFLKEAA